MVSPRTPSEFDVEAWMREFRNLGEDELGGGLISVDELRAAGALDAPPSWRKTLRVERDLFSGLFETARPAAEQKPITSIAGHGNASPEVSGPQ